jgi:hypothetical protein
MLLHGDALKQVWERRHGRQMCTDTKQDKAKFCSIPIFLQNHAYSGQGLVVSLLIPKQILVLEFHD